MSTPWFVLGAGSIGCLYAAYLQRAGFATTLLLRDAARLQTFVESGLTLRVDEREEAVPIAAQTVDGGAPIERLLLCTKAPHSRTAVESLRPRLADDVRIVLLQNGMGVREELAPLLPQAHFAHALSTEGAWQPRRFAVVHAGRGETLLGGDAVCAELAAQLNRSGLHASVAGDIETRLWQKLAVNCAINPLTALHRCRNGELRALADLEAQIAAVCAEIAAVAAAAGIALDAAELGARVQAVIAATAANRSSMLQDVEAGRGTEIDYLNGFVMREGLRLGVPTPANAALHAAVCALGSTEKAAAIARRPM